MKSRAKSTIRNEPPASPITDNDIDKILDELYEPEEPPADNEFTVKTAAVRWRINKRTAQSMLDRMIEAGTVTRRPYKRTYLYRKA